MNMRSLGKAASTANLSRLEKEQMPNPRIIFVCKQMETTCFRFLCKLIIHVADVICRLVSIELLPQMIYVTIEESGNVIISNEFASRNYSNKIAVPYREFFAELDRFLLFGDSKKLANLIGRGSFESLEKVVNYERYYIYHDIFLANV